MSRISCSGWNTACILQQLAFNPIFYNRRERKSCKNGALFVSLKKRNEREQQILSLFQTIYPSNQLCTDGQIHLVAVIFLKNWQSNVSGKYRLSRPKYALHSIVSTKNKISKSYFANTSPFDKHSYIKYQTLCRRNAKLCPYQFHVEFTHTGNYKSLFCGNPI